MTKEQFIEVMKMPEIPMSLWFEYYRERGGYIADPVEFERVFTVMLRNEGSVKGADGTLKQITLKSSYDNFYAYYKQKFEL